MSRLNATTRPPRKKSATYMLSDEIIQFIRLLAETNDKSASATAEDLFRTHPLFLSQIVHFEKQNTLENNQQAA
ncbi:MAG: hypothetical protein LCH85_22115 [Chloroflexi bacterium]|nr:hypothetical protein [Chloroflexota bacterium]